MKLIKINTDHYVIVDDSEIKEGDWLYSFDNGLIVQANRSSADTINSKSLSGRGYAKITHSTKPMIECEDGKGTFGNVKQLSLSEVKELLGIVNVEKKAELYCRDKWEYTKEENKESFINGYNQAIEDNKNKKYTEKDLYRLMEILTNTESRMMFEVTTRIFIESLQKNEWEVEIIDGQLKQTNNEILHNRRN